MTVYYVDPENGNDSHAGTSFSTAVRTIGAGIALVSSSSDSVRVKASPPSYLAPSTATWTQGSNVVTLSSAMTVTLSDCESGWTAASGTSISYVTSDKRQGSSSLYINGGSITATDELKLLCYLPVSDLNLNTYNQISYWLEPNNSTPFSASFYPVICYCSDSAGATPICSFPLNTSNLTSPSSAWIPITSAGSGEVVGVNSIAVYVYCGVSANVVFSLDNLMAVQGVGPTSDNVLSLNSLVSLDRLAWWAIQSIDGTTVRLDSVVSGSIGGEKGFRSVEFNTYVVESPQTGTSVSSADFYVRQPFSINAGIPGVIIGNSLYVIPISGGWDRNFMSTQTDFSYYDGGGASGSGTQIFYIENSPLNLSHFGAVRGYCGFYINTSTALYNPSVIDNCQVVACTGFGFNAVEGRVTFTGINIAVQGLNSFQQGVESYTVSLTDPNNPSTSYFICLSPQTNGITSSSAAPYLYGSGTIGVNGAGNLGAILSGETNLQFLQTDNCFSSGLQIYNPTGSTYIGTFQSNYSGYALNIEYLEYSTQITLDYVSTSNSVSNPVLLGGLGQFTQINIGTWNSADETTFNFSSLTINSLPYYKSYLGGIFNPAPTGSPFSSGSSMRVVAGGYTGVTAGGYSDNFSYGVYPTVATSGSPFTPTSNFPISILLAEFLAEAGNLTANVYINRSSTNVNAQLRFQFKPSPAGADVIILPITISGGSWQLVSLTGSISPPSATYSVGNLFLDVWPVPGYASESVLASDVSITIT